MECGKIKEKSRQCFPGPLIYLIHLVTQTDATFRRKSGEGTEQSRKPGVSPASQPSPTLFTLPAGWGEGHLVATHVPTADMQDSGSRAPSQTGTTGQPEGKGQWEASELALCSAAKVQESRMNDVTALRCGQYCPNQSMSHHGHLW